jgi:hypothetical protein
MSLSIEVKFKLGETVYMNLFRETGQVISYFVDTSGVQYKVRYAGNGEIKEVYFYEHELSTPVLSSQIGGFKGE